MLISSIDVNHLFVYYFEKEIFINPENYGVALGQILFPRFLVAEKVLLFNLYFGWNNKQLPLSMV